MRVVMEPKKEKYYLMLDDVIFRDGEYDFQFSLYNTEAVPPNTVSKQKPEYLYNFEKKSYSENITTIRYTLIPFESKSTLRYMYINNKFGSTMDEIGYIRNLFYREILKAWNDLTGDKNENETISQLQ